ncbi:MAG: hypothetical protein ACXVEW_04475 [Solirubrobacteraceae bacterium]
MPRPQLEPGDELELLQRRDFVQKASDGGLDQGFGVGLGQARESTCYAC